MQKKFLKNVLNFPDLSSWEKTTSKSNHFQTPHGEVCAWCRWKRMWKCFIFTLYVIYVKNLMILKTQRSYDMNKNALCCDCDESCDTVMGECHIVDQLYRHLTITDAEPLSPDATSVSSWVRCDFYSWLSALTFTISNVWIKLLPSRAFFKRRLHS